MIGCNGLQTRALDNPYIRNNQLQEFCFLRKRAESCPFSIGSGRCSLWRELNKIINNVYE